MCFFFFDVPPQKKTSGSKTQFFLPGTFGAGRTVPQLVRKNVFVLLFFLKKKMFFTPQKKTCFFPNPTLTSSGMLSSLKEAKEGKYSQSISSLIRLKAETTIAIRLRRPHPLCHTLKRWLAPGDKENIQNAVIKHESTLRTVLGSASQKPTSCGDQEM